MEWAEIINSIPYGKAGMIIGFVLVLLIVIFWFQDRLTKRVFDYLTKLIGKDKSKD